MRTSLFFLPLVLLGCPTDGDSSDKSDTDSLLDDSGDTSDTAMNELTGITWDFADPTISTRGPLSVVVTATYDDGSTADVSAAAAWSSSDPNVAKVYVAGQVQPINAGATTLGASFGGLDLSGTLTVTVVAATNADLVFNEVLADGSVEGDPNGDGAAEPTEDEFVEIVNVSGVTVDLSGCVVVEGDLSTDEPRHTFAQGTLLHAGEAVVLFGGGDVSSLSAANVTFLVVANLDVGLKHGLALNNEGDKVELRDPSGGVLTTFTSGSGGDIDAIQGASMVRSPDVTGTSWTHHTYATGSAGDYSPGTYVDGSAFPGIDGFYTP